MRSVEGGRLSASDAADGSQRGTLAKVILFFYYAFPAHFSASRRFRLCANSLKEQEKKMISHTGFGFVRLKLRSLSYELCAFLRNCSVRWQTFLKKHGPENLTRFIN